MKHRKARQGIFAFVEMTMGFAIIAVLRSISR
jgi:hypothetical protein